MTRPAMPWRDRLPDWPLEARAEWGRLANLYTPEGMDGWVEAERRAANEVHLRMRRGEFRDAADAPATPSGRCRRAAGTPSLGFDAAGGRR